MLSIRPQGSKGRFYSPERDIAYLAPAIIRRALDNVINPDTDYMKWFKKHARLNEADFGLVAKTLARYLNDCHNKEWTIEQVFLLYDETLKDCPAAKYCVYCAIAQCLLTTMYSAVRDITDEDAKQFNVDRLTEASSWVETYASWSRFHRWVVYGWQRLRAWFSPGSHPTVMRPDTHKGDK